MSFYKHALSSQIFKQYLPLSCKIPTAACVGGPGFCGEEKRVVDDREVREDQIEDDIQPDEQVENAHRRCLRGISIVPLELLVAPVKQVLDVIVPLRESVEAPIHEILLAVGCLAYEVRADGVASLVDAELDRAAANARLHPLEHHRLQDDVDGTEEEGDGAEVPVCKRITEVCLIVD